MFDGKLLFDATLDARYFDQLPPEWRELLASADLCISAVTVHGLLEQHFSPSRLRELLAEFVVEWPKVPESERLAIYNELFPKIEAQLRERGLNVKIKKIEKKLGTGMEVPF